MELTPENIYRLSPSRAWRAREDGIKAYSHRENDIFKIRDDRKTAPSLPTHTQLARDATPNEDIAALSCRLLRQGVDGSRHARLAKMWSERDVHIIRGPIPYKDWPTLD